MYSAINIKETIENYYQKLHRILIKKTFFIFIDTIQYNKGIINRTNFNFN